MSAISKLIDKVKGNIGLMIGTVLILLIAILAVAGIVGSILIFGLNLMGFSIPFTVKTIIGAVIVISCLRSMGSGTKQ
jgi:hypothetical protein